MTAAEPVGTPRWSPPGLDGWRPRLVALDVDGTVASLEGEVSPAVHDAVARVIAAGAHVVLATGRALLATRPVADVLGLTGGYMVCSNGAVVATIDPPQVIEAVTFDASSAVRLLLDLAPDTLVAVEQLGVGYRVNAPFPPGELAGDQAVCDLDELVATPVTKVVLRRPNGTPEEFFDLVERAGLHGVNYAIGYTAWMDILPSDVSKASALARVCARLGVPQSATLAVGDGRNDLEMLRWAGVGVAMGHAPAEVQDAADQVTWPIEDDGLVPVLDRWFA